MLRFALGIALAMTIVSPAAAAPATSTHQHLVALFSAWRAFNHPAIVHGKPDYSAPAMSEKAARLPQFRQRLAAIDPKTWNASARGDYRLVEAEMNGLDFF